MCLTRRSTGRRCTARRWTPFLVDEAYPRPRISSLSTCLITSPSITCLITSQDYFPAVATTDILSRVADALCCKPSELAFYPVPKLMIRRVGDHEAYSALRASELGDGTLELREVKPPPLEPSHRHGTTTQAF